MQKNRLQGAFSKSLANNFTLIYNKYAQFH